MSEVNLSDIAIQFDETDIEAATARTVYRPGWYRWRVTAAQPHVTTKEGKSKGNMSLRQRVAAVDSDGNTTEPRGLSHFLTYPKKTPPDVLVAAGIEEDFKQAKVPNTIGIIQGYLRITRPDEFPSFPKKSEDNPEMYVSSKTGELITAEERKEERDELLANLGAFLASAWSDPSLTVGDEFFGELSYRSTKGYPNINKIRAALPDDAELVDTDEAIISESELEEILASENA